MKELQEKLIELKEKYGAIGVKFEYESESFQESELSKLHNIIKNSNMSFGIKLGGLSSYKDMLEAKKLKADIITAPMVESSYALQKFIKTSDIVFIENKPKYYISIETKTSVDNIEDILKSPYSNKIEGIIFGRGDLASSLNIEDVENDKILQISKAIKKEIVKCNKKMIIGGEITTKSIRFLNNIDPDFTETRKIIFEGVPKEEGIIKAIEFERALISKKEDKSPNDYLRLEKLKERIKA